MLGPLRDGQFRLFTYRVTHGTVYGSRAVCNIDAMRNSYVALSYAWSVGSDVVTNIDGQRVRTQSSAVAALLGLQRPTRELHEDLDVWSSQPERRVWIDSICIDQTSKRDKEQQINWMRQIYTSAACVVIWLGEEDPSSIKAIAYLQYLNVQYNELIRQGNSASCWPLVNLQAYHSLCDLLENRWFHRRWIIQEAALAQKALIICGSHAIRFDQLASGIQILAKAISDMPPNQMWMPGRAPNIAPPMAIYRMRMRRRTESPSLLELLDTFNNSQASEPCDYIFSLLGLCKDEESRAITINYRLGPEAVFRRAALAHGKTTGRLEFLAICNELARLDGIRVTGSTSDDRREYIGPSWTPNWASQFATRYLEPGLLNTEHVYRDIYHASKDCTVRGSIDFDAVRDVLPVSLVGIGTISQIDRFIRGGNNETGGEGHQFNMGDPHNEYYTLAFDFLMTGLAPGPYASRNARARAFVATITLGGRCSDGLLDFEAVLAQVHHRFSGTELLHRLIEAGLHPSPNTQGQDIEQLANWSTLHYFRLFILNNGYMGLARFRCRLNDRVCVVKGCSVPLVLRPRQDGRYLVIGEAYVHGFMNGEAIEKLERSGEKDEVAELV